MLVTCVGTFCGPSVRKVCGPLKWTCPAASFLKESRMCNFGLQIPKRKAGCASMVPGFSKEKQDAQPCPVSQKKSGMCNRGLRFLKRKQQPWSLASQKKAGCATVVSGFSKEKQDVQPWSPVSLKKKQDAQPRPGFSKEKQAPPWSLVSQKKNWMCNRGLRFLKRKPRCATVVSVF